MFTEANAVRDYIRDQTIGLGWVFISGPDLPRGLDEVFVIEHLRGALARLNPEIAADPSRADEVLYRLNAILLSVPAEGVVRASENLRAWLLGEKSMPFGENGRHVTVRLLDFDNLTNNDFVVSTEVTYRPRPDIEKRYDIVLYVNGLPMVVGECKTATRPSISWVDGAAQIYDDYEANTPMFFVPNVFSFASEGKTYRYGSTRMPIEQWGPWRAEEGLSGLEEVRAAVAAMLHPAVVLDLLRFFTVYATDKKHRKIKVIARYQQYYGLTRSSSG